MRLSIVTTLYKSAPTLDRFYRRAKAAAEVLTNDYEIVMVDDGSPDNSLALATEISERDHRVRVVELSRNFGHHKALMTGLDHSTGELCFLIDSDLEEDPELLAAFFDKLEDSGADVVYGYQEDRKGGIGERLTGYIAYWLFKLLIAFPVPRNHITVRLMRREYVDSLLMHKERQTVIGGLWIITGFRQIGVPVAKLSKGTSTYSLWRRWRMLIDSVTSFSEVPLVGIFYLGIIICMLSAVVGFSLLFRKLFLGQVLAGWTSVMISVWFLGGLLILCVGVVGIYISKIFIETKNRPYSIVRKVHQKDAADAANDRGAHAVTKDTRFQDSRGQ
ncbi:glycosyltransferase family 2 protein [Bradyrhizobium sp. 1]|uniref:glycosyltransferase family 2 protein n=1 Tax=Bradyrhizobium sp. 1 TaxID=241591 RepID=UPI001FFB992F|nr:glycosyltransferase family 2 protein [Bradyrhizobium sp. 1]MCK1393558.1 glycosyltransferase family 2 protein [Bradyrhizobium sp. 1]